MTTLIGKTRAAGHGATAPQIALEQRARPSHFARTALSLIVALLGAAVAVQAAISPGAPTLLH